jgi:hypothetical protein
MSPQPTTCRLCAIAHTFGDAACDYQLGKPAFAAGLPRRQLEGDDA